MNLNKYIKRKLISHINEEEINRYSSFFSNSFKENLAHSKANISNFPRWSIISGYYAMHDITKLFLVKKLNIKIDFNVHKTTIEILKEIKTDKELLKLLKTGYSEFILLLNDLTKAKKERTKMQYYTGSDFMRNKYKEKSPQFLEKIVIPYLNKINSLLK
ncbi:MAG: hypothetical protein AABX11_00075 [Nanoarchaeota archaeon]